MGIEVEVARDLAVVMIIAALVAIAFHKLRHPAILGYLVAGIIIGPYTPPFSLVTHIEILNIFAELGVILLLFSVGLEFPIARLRSVGKVSMGVAFMELALMLIIGYLIGVAFNWPFLDSLFLAAALSISSTAVIIKTLEDFGVLREEPSLIMLGILIIEDLAAVVMIASLQSIVSMGMLSLQTIFFTVVKIGLFIGGVLAVGTLVIPRLVDRVVELNRRELTLISVLGLCFGLSMIADQLGFSVAIGAFLAGVLIAESQSSESVATFTGSLKDMFAAIFFVSFGALMDVGLLPAFFASTILITIATIGAKFLGVGLGVRAFGYRAPTAIRSGLGMAPRGEFSLIIVKIGHDLNVVSPFLFPMVGIVAGITTFLTPYLMKLGVEIEQS